MRSLLISVWFLLVCLPVHAFTFKNIDGGLIDTAAWIGRPVLVVNTATQCGLTDQLTGLQALWDQYRDQGLIVLAVPSTDYHSELEDPEEIKAICELYYGTTMPMTDITPVFGTTAHPFYLWVNKQTGFNPNWNFGKVLIGRDGTVVDTWESVVQPMAPEIIRAIERQLGEGM